jgi:predicted MPP superfamily phosphohydrolase
MKEYGATLLNNEAIKFSNFTLVWLWSRWAWEDDIDFLETFGEEENIVALFHNPDTTLSYRENNADVSLAWHTHGWQIKIPFLYKHIIPTIGDFDEWFTQEKFTKLFITSWIGTDHLPLRFLNPPVIDILEIE